MTVRIVKWLCAGGLTVCLVVPAGAGSVSIGDTYDQVVALLGEPRLHIASDEFNLLQFDRGSVYLEDGHVVSFALVSREEAVLRAAAEQAERERRLLVEQERRARQREEGLALRNRMLSDPEFLSLPSGRRYAYWRQFRVLYPDVNVHEILALAQHEYHLDLQARRRAEEEWRRDLRHLEERVRVAEQRVVRAAIHPPYDGGIAPYYPVRVIVSARPQGHTRVRDDRALSRPHRHAPGTVVHSTPVVQRGSVTPSRLDAVFGSMPTTSAPGYRGSASSPNRVRFGF